jgi:hypothetical protein
MARHLADIFDVLGVNVWRCERQSGVVSSLSATLTLGLLLFLLDSGAIPGFASLVDGRLHFHVTTIAEGTRPNIIRKYGGFLRT